jgi:hypothetical protein
MVQRVFEGSARYALSSVCVWLLGVVFIVSALVVVAPSVEAASRADVKAIQMMLNKLGYPSGRPDGAMGRNTRKAIRNYQRDHSLLTDGKASAELREHIEGKVSSASASSRTQKAAGPAKKPAAALFGQRTQTTPAPASSSAPALLGKRKQATADVTLAKAVSLRAGVLRQLPSTRAVQIGRFVVKTRFDILARRGLWVDVAFEKGGQRGWARLGAVRLLPDSRDSRVAAPATSSAQPQRSDNSGFSGFARSLTGWLGGGHRTSQSRWTSTIGIRGLTRGELSGDGRPDMAALARLDRIANPDAAGVFARSGGLAGQSVPYPQLRSPAAQQSNDGKVKN